MGRLRCRSPPQAGPACALLNRRRKRIRTPTTQYFLQPKSTALYNHQTQYRQLEQSRKSKVFINFTQHYTTLHNSTQLDTTLHNFTQLLHFCCTQLKKVKICWQQNKNTIYKKNQKFTNVVKHTQVYKMQTKIL